MDVRNEFGCDVYYLNNFFFFCVFSFARLYFFQKNVWNFVQKFAKLVKKFKKFVLAHIRLKTRNSVTY